MPLKYGDVVYLHIDGDANFGTDFISVPFEVTQVRELAVTQINGQSVNTGQTITLSSGALVTVQADHSFSYDPNGQFDSLDSGEIDTDSFTYTAFDGMSCDTATVTVIIQGITAINANDDFASTTETDSLSINLLTNDTGLSLLQLEDVKFVSVEGGFADSLNKASFGIVNGEVYFDPGTDFAHLNEGEAATVVLSYEMSDAYLKSGIVELLENLQEIAIPGFGTAPEGLRDGTNLTIVGSVDA